MIWPHLSWHPLLPVGGLAVIFLVALIFLAVSARRGAPLGWRLLPIVALLAALANPRLVEETATAQDDIAVVLVDDSPSMELGDRPRQSALAVEGMVARLKALGHMEVRVEHYRPAAGRDEGTRLIGALQRILADIPRRRLAGVVLVSDGQIVDGADKTDIGAPLHLLLAGHQGERDRRLVVDQAPAFGIVGSTVTLAVTIDDAGQQGRAGLTIRRDGGAPQRFDLPLNQQTRVDLPIDHAGPNVVEMAVDGVPGELTEENNRAALSVSGIRDRMRVLLVSGEPHAGERTWRNLLKADPAVDLVHFTILRPPDKDDRTPLRDLALISFPVRELFEEKLSGFDLVILDRYRRRSVLPPAYYQNIANYVKAGGALLLAAGPEYAAPDTLYNTALSEILPAAPTGRVREESFLPHVTDLGHRHPVTAGLMGGETDPPHWGEWVRLVESHPKAGSSVVMDGLAGDPLLVLDRVGEGRVAQLMSDTVWLWTRGWDGGGPQAELLRRLAHWLMKEPALEEEQLGAEIRDGKLAVQRRSLAKGDHQVRVIAPDGTAQDLVLADQGDGLASASLPVTQAGLWRVEDGAHVALVASGSLNPIEMAEVRASPDKLKPWLEAAGGHWRWIDGGLPDVRKVTPGGAMPTAGVFAFRANEDRIVTALRDHALIPGWILLILGFGGLVLAWWREGR